MSGVCGSVSRATVSEPAEKEQQTFHFSDSCPRNRAAEPRSVFSLFSTAIFQTPAAHYRPFTAHQCAIVHQLKIAGLESGPGKGHI